MKRMLAFLCIIAALCMFTSCQSKKETVKDTSAVVPETTVTETLPQVEAPKETTPQEKKELIVFAAASMTETLDKLKPLFEEKFPDVKLTYNFDSSGTLLKQILAGADCDVFISAAQKQINQLDGTKDEKDNPDKNDLLMPNTRQNLLENKVVLVVPSSNPAKIEKFSDINTDKLKMLAIGNSDVPVGSYTLDILKSIGTSAEKLESDKKITYGSNVKEVTTQVKEGLVDAGIIYATDAFSAGLDVVDTANKDMCKQVIYPIAILKATKNEEAAKNFLQYLLGDEATEIFKEVGFSRP